MICGRGYTHFSTFFERSSCAMAISNIERNSIENRTPVAKKLYTDNSKSIYSIAIVSYTWNNYWMNHAYRFAKKNWCRFVKFLCFDSRWGPKTQPSALNHRFLFPFYISIACVVIFCSFAFICDCAHDVLGPFVDAEKYMYGCYQIAHNVRCVRKSIFAYIT